MMEVILFSKISVLTRATRRNISADGILYSHCRENPRSYMLSIFPPITPFLNHLWLATSDISIPCSFVVVS
jgi:hypothetical protein